MLGAAALTPALVPQQAQLLHPVTAAHGTAAHPLERLLPLLPRWPLSFAPLGLAAQQLHQTLLAAAGQSWLQVARWSWLAAALGKMAGQLQWAEWR